MNTTTESIKAIVDVAISNFPSDHEFTAYGVHTVINAIHEVIDRPATAPQPIYGRIKAFLKVESMSGIKLNSVQVKDFLIAYLTGSAKTEVTGLADKIKEGLAAQAPKKINA